MTPYTYIEHKGNFLPTRYMPMSTNWTKPIMWAKEGQYGWISKEQVRNVYRRWMDLGKQQKGYTKDKPLALAFHWSEVQILDPITVRLMGTISPQG